MFRVIAAIFDLTFLCISLAMSNLAKTLLILSHPYISLSHAHSTPSTFSSVKILLSISQNII